MPASRSRTEHWRDSLRKVFERGGALEITVDRSGDSDDSGFASDLAWRVKMVALHEDRIIVEPPAACGHIIPLSAGVKLIVAMTIGQNRWMFHSQTLGHLEGPGNQGHMLVMQMPTNVERCTRRDFYRISTASVRLPSVQCWPLMDPSSVILPEAANRAQITELMEAGKILSADTSLSTPTPLLPEVGPMFTAQLLNVSGGGLGLVLRPEDARVLDSRPFVWLRVDLRPEIAAPVAVTCRVAHSHLDSAHNLYAGLAFDFVHNQEHRRFVVDLFAEYANRLMSRQSSAKAA